MTNRDGGGGKRKNHSQPNKENEVTEKAEAMADEHDVMMTTPAAKEMKEPSVSPAAVTDRTGAEQEALAEYKEKAERFQRTRYGKSFCKEDEGEYEIKQIPTEQGQRQIDEANDMGITFVMVVDGHREPMETIANAIGLTIKATMGPGAKLEGEMVRSRGAMRPRWTWRHPAWQRCGQRRRS